MQLSMQCQGNGVDWHSGNSLHIDDSVIQGYAQFGVRGGRAWGGYGNYVLTNVYEESGCDRNPLTGLGNAGIIAQGGNWTIVGGEGPQGLVRQFANTGTTRANYFIVWHGGGSQESYPLYIGFAMTDGTTPVTIHFPDIQGATPASSYDVLKTPGPQPSGSGIWAIATNVLPSTACSAGVCTVTDTQALPQLYSTAVTFGPLLDQWGADIVLSYGASLRLIGTSDVSAYSIISTSGAAVSDVVPAYGGSALVSHGATFSDRAGHQQ